MRRPVFLRQGVPVPGRTPYILPVLRFPVTVEYLTSRVCLFVFLEHKRDIASVNPDSPRDGLAIGHSINTQNACAHERSRKRQVPDIETSPATCYVLAL